MKVLFNSLLFATCFGGLCIAEESVKRETGTRSTVRFIAEGSFHGNEMDRSGLNGTLEEGTPENRLGGFSAIDYVSGDEWLVLSDRGPADGATEFPCRFHRVQLKIDKTSQKILPQLLETKLLMHPTKVPLRGSLKALASPSEVRSFALDPEGLRRLPSGSILISDEYGPSFDRFQKDGSWMNGWRVPEKMVLAADPSTATSGTVPNRGMEGLAISHDEKFIVGAMQGPLYQDSREENGKRNGLFARLVQFPIDASRDSDMRGQWVYPLEDVTCGISEILAVDDSRYLVIERDGLVGSLAKYKRIYLIDTREATTISTETEVDPFQLSSSIKPVTKTLLIDLLDPAYGFSGEKALVKPEGLAWGPATSDKERTLIVCVDNDFNPETPSRFLAFSISK